MINLMNYNNYNNLPHVVEILLKLPYMVAIYENVDENHCIWPIHCDKMSTQFNTKTAVSSCHYLLKNV